MREEGGETLAQGVTESRVFVWRIMSSVIFERIIERVRTLGVKRSISISGFGIQLENCKESVFILLKEDFQL